MLIIYRVMVCHKALPYAEIKFKYNVNMEDIIKIILILVMFWKLNNIFRKVAKDNFF